MSTIVNDLVSYLQCGETIAIRDAVRINSADGKIYKFDPLNATHVFAGIAKEGGVLNDYIRVVQSGRVKGFSGLTAGAFVYASVTTPGSFQLVEPVASQKIILGIAKSTTELTVNGALGIKPGGDGAGGGGLDVYYTQDMEGLADTSAFAKGNNAAFLGGGTLQGTLALESVSPISGTKSLKYTQAAGSLNDYFASAVIDLDAKQKSNTSGMTLYFTYNGNDNDMKFVVWDVTNGRELSNQVSFVKLANTATRYSLSFYVPSSCNQIRWGAQVLVVNSGKVLVVDDVEMSTDPFQIVDLDNMVDSVNFTPTGSWVANTTYAGRYSRVGERAIIQYRVAVTGAPTAAALSLNLPPGLTVDESKLVSSDIYYNNTGTVLDSGTERFIAFGRYNLSTNLVEVHVAGSAGTYANSVVVSNTVPMTWANGDDLTITIALPIMNWTASTSSILTPSDTFSTDTAPLTYAGSASYTLSTLANAPVGTFITFTYAANTNTRTQTTTAPTQTTSDMNTNGILLYTRAYNAASTAAQPAAIAIQIGKGLKGVSKNLYKSTGKVTSGELEAQQNGANGYGAEINSYNEVTGILVIDSGVRINTSNTSAQFLFSDLTGQSSGYIVINAGKTPSLLAVPTPQVAYLKDVKPSGTAGGTFTAGAWQTRTLNTVEGDSSIVSLSANQFTLGPGLYEIEAYAPMSSNTGFGKAKIRSITDSSDLIIGNSSSTSPAGGLSAVVGWCSVIGRINLTASKVLELQHQCQNTGATTGFGQASSFGVSEVYSTIKIKKVG